MTTMRWFRTGGSSRGAPVLRGSIRRQPLAMLLLVLVSLAQTGCQSGFFGPCGPCSRLRTLSTRVFRGAAPAGACCNGAAPAAIGSDVPVVDYGTPAVIPPATTSGAPLPSGPTESLPSQLEPIPQAQPGPPAEAAPSQGAKSSTGKVNYEAARSRYRSGVRRGDHLARALIPPPVPTPRSTRGATSSSRATSEMNPLDNLPPLELPKELTRNDRPLSAGPPPSPSPNRPPPSDPPRLRPQRCQPPRWPKLPPPRTPLRRT